MQARQSNPVLKSILSGTRSAIPSHAARVDTLSHFSTSGEHFTTETSVVGIRYSNERAVMYTGYHPSRTRSRLATAVLNGFCRVVGSVMLTSRLNRDELFERYDRKLWSYGDRVILFTIATIPSVAALAAIYVASRAIQSFRMVFLPLN